MSRKNGSATGRSLIISRLRSEKETSFPARKLTGDHLAAPQCKEQGLNASSSIREVSASIFVTSDPVPLFH